MRGRDQGLPEDIDFIIVFQVVNSLFEVRKCWIAR